MEFVVGKHYVTDEVPSKKLRLVAWSTESTAEALIFESPSWCVRYFRDWCELHMKEYREPIECVRWGFYMPDGDGGSVLYYSINKQHIEKEHAKFMKCGTTCSEIIEIRGTMK
jgi:hypothetical protein